VPVRRLRHEGRRLEPGGVLHHGYVGARERAHQGGGHVGVARLASLASGRCARQHHDVGVLHHRAGDVTDTAVVVRGRAAAPVGQGVVAEQVPDDGGVVEGGDDGRDAEPAGEARVAGQHGADLVGLGADRELHDDRAPPAVAGEPVEGGQHVLAQRAADAGVLELGLLVLHHPGEVGHDPLEHPPSRVDAVAHGDGLRRVPQERELRGGHRVRVDTGHEQHGSPHDADPEPRGAAPAPYRRLKASTRPSVSRTRPLPVHQGWLAEETSTSTTG
jgi:hypothetical protein